MCPLRVWVFYRTIQNMASARRDSYRCPFRVWVFHRAIQNMSSARADSYKLQMFSKGVSISEQYRTCRQQDRIRTNVLSGCEYFRTMDSYKCPLWVWVFHRTIQNMASARQDSYKCPFRVWVFQSNTKRVVSKRKLVQMSSQGASISEQYRTWRQQDRTCKNVLSGCEYMRTIQNMASARRD